MAGKATGTSTNKTQTNAMNPANPNIARRSQKLLESIPKEAAPQPEEANKE
jgi:hypothetical protein